ncbi:MAG: DUF5722 domain-containing protein [Suilimivivens sp.]
MYPNYYTRIINSMKTGFLFLLFLCLLLFFSGCGREVSTVADNASVSGPDISQSSLTDKEAEEMASQAEKERLQTLSKGNITLSKKNLATFGSVTDCIFQSDGEHVSLTLSLPDIPKSDDAYIYLFAFETYDSNHTFDGRPLTYSEKATTCTLTFSYQEGQLFQEFVPALLLNGKYVPVATGSYITNPEVIADNQDSYPTAASKKGLLLDPEMLGTPLLTDLGVQHAIYNIPLSLILGETTNTDYPTISYEFMGNTYHFNGAAINSYDNLFTYLTNSGMLSTAIILNDWNEEFPELIHPKSRNSKSGAYYYAFNTAEEEGCRSLEAIASFLTERYSNGSHGLVSSWVIANEINQPQVWNYMDTSDINYYASEFEKALRIFYNAAKSNYANAKVYFSIDHAWNSNEGRNDKFFNGKDLLEAINNSACAKGNYNWGLAIHPYPKPLTRVNYWDADYDKTIDSPLLTLMNLSTVTDFLRQEEYLDQNGDVRSITVTELGFSSTSGEKLQAAAFAYCYYIIDANPYIEAFIMNRQTDAKEEVNQGLAFGIYELDHTDKFILEVFKYIDTDRADEYLDFMLNILGAESLEEALSWAQ